MLDPFTAGIALTTRFFFEKIEKISGHIHHAGILVHDNHTAGAHHGADFRQLIKVDAQIQVLFRDTSARRTAGLNRFELLLFGYSAADVINNGSLSSFPWGLPPNRY